MKAFEIEVLSRQTVKPSSPTPDHLRHYQFSFLDQVNPPVFMPITLFFPNVEFGNTLDTSEHLKKSLSEALSKFYVLAGRVVDNSYVDCNDEGVPYIEARIRCRVSDIIQDPTPNELNKFIPCALDDVKDLPMVVQVTHFDCGGLAVALAVTHKVADAMSFFMFLNSWAAVARGDHDSMPPPVFESATLFPPRDIAGFKPNTGMFKDKIITKRFVFAASKITALRERYANKAAGGEFPRRTTRVEALSAFIWTRFMASTQRKLSEPDKIHTVLHAVNLRTKVDPPLPDYYFGNISRPAIAVPTGTENEETCHGILDLMRDAIRKMNSDYVNKLRDSDKHLNFLKERSKSVTMGEVVSFSFTSLCRFPIYEADFGWGKPAWVGSASLTFKNLVVFLDTKTGGGIEAWVNLKEEEMSKFEADKEFLSYVLPSSDAKNSGA